MNSELVVDVQPNEISIALLEHKSLVEYQQEGQNSSLDDIALGFVHHVGVSTVRLLALLISSTLAIQSITPIQANAQARPTAEVSAFSRAEVAFIQDHSIS